MINITMQEVDSSTALLENCALQSISWEKLCSPTSVCYAGNCVCNRTFNMVWFLFFLLLQPHNGDLKNSAAEACGKPKKKMKSKK